MSKSEPRTSELSRTTADTPRAPGRRAFCVQAGQAVSIVTLGAVFPACGGGGNPAAPSGGGGNVSFLQILNGSVAGNQITLVVSSTPLETVGSSALLQSAAGDFLVTRSSMNGFTVVTATCTHEACRVDGISNGTFVCPCHGSRYTTSGSVINGPATQSLRTFGTQFDGTTLTITT